MKKIKLLFLILLVLTAILILMAYITTYAYSPIHAYSEQSNINTLLSNKNANLSTTQAYSYDAMIKECLLTAQEALGEYYINLRNVQCPENKYTYEDLEVLSKIITAEAGMKWLDEYIRMCVGEVVLNRVASTEFPNTILEVIYEPGQYHHVLYNLFDAVVPTAQCIVVAQKLLNGERVINNTAVVFQANFPQGSGIYEVIYDERLGYTYLCYSNNLEIYLQNPKK